MRYIGGKCRLSKKIVQAIEPFRKDGQYWVEPFVGGCNVIDKVKGNRIGSDFNHYVIAMWKAIQNGWDAPQSMSIEEWKDIKYNQDKYPAELVGFAGSGCSFNGKWFDSYGGHTSDKAKNERNYCKEQYNSIRKQRPLIQGVKFINSSYELLEIPKNSIIYCDPPYQSCKRKIYLSQIDQEKFWQWCRDKANDGHSIFISEYSAPEDFTCLAEFDHWLLVNPGTSKKVTEKLFTL